MYSVFDYGRMAADGVRMSAYARAIARVVTPGSVVVDLGCGTGILSLLAARAGAKRVHAVDVNPAVWLVPELAAENGAADRITVHHESSFEVALPEPADVVIGDLRGPSPFNADNLALMHDAKARMLAPGGVMMPARDRLMVALVEAEGLSGMLERAWRCFDRFGLSAKATKSSILNAVYNDWRHPILASDVVSTRESWATVEYGDAAPDVFEGTVELAATRDGTAHGLAIWFEATVHGDLRFESAPGTGLVYVRTYLPLLEPVRLADGHRATVTVRVDPRGDRWAWDTRVVDGAGGEVARLRQATFLGLPTTPQALLRSSTGFRPERSSGGDRLRRVLDAMDGTKTIAEIAESIGDGTTDAALRARRLDEVRDAVERYGR